MSEYSPTNESVITPAVNDPYPGGPPFGDPEVSRSTEHREPASGTPSHEEPILDGVLPAAVTHFAGNFDHSEEKIHSLEEQLKKAENDLHGVTEEISKAGKFISPWKRAKLQKKYQEAIDQKNHMLELLNKFKRGNGERERNTTFH